MRERTRQANLRAQAANEAYYCETLRIEQEDRDAEYAAGSAQARADYELRRADERSRAAGYPTRYEMGMSMAAQRVMFDTLRDIADKTRAAGYSHPHFIYDN